MFKPNMNFHRGFHVWRWIRGQEADAYESKPHQVDLNRYIKPEMKDSLIIRNLDQYFRNVQNRQKEEDYFVAQVMTEAAQWLTDNHEIRQPFFLYVDCFDPHEPWDPPPEFAAKYIDPNYKGPWIINPKFGPRDWMTDAELHHTRMLYAAEVTFVDKWVGYLIDRIRELGLMDNSIILFLSDHGHPHGDHGQMLKMVDNLYSELLRIPLMVRFPNKEYAGKRINALVSMVDIFPTIMETIGHPQEAEFVQGKSFIPLISGQAEKIHPYVTMGFFASEDRCLRDETWSYIRRSGDRENELYHLIDDPKETKNLVNEYLDTSKEMEEAIAKVFECRLQKEHMNQLWFDVPGLCEKRFPPVRYWKK